MSNEEAIALLEEMIGRCNMPSATDPKKYQKSDALKIAIDAIEHQDKYRWHDLRKNPDDLPEEIKKWGISVSEAVIIVMAGSNIPMVGYYDYTHSRWIAIGQIADTIAKRKVIKWRYIEPFEEGAE